MRRQGPESGAGVSGTAVSRIVSFVLLLAGFVLPLFIGAGVAEARRGSDLPNGYILTGVIGLEYERRWGTSSGADVPSINSFTQSYSLGVRGPIVDPRLAIFNITGDFIDKSGIEGYRSKGVTAELDLLNEILEIRNPKYKFLNYMPKPIILRYSHYSGDDYSNTNYGVSMSYYLPVYFHFFSDGKFVSVKSNNELPGRLKFNQLINNVNNRNGNGNGNGNDSNNNNSNNNNQSNNQNQSQQNQNQQYRYAEPSGLIVPFPFFSVDYDKNTYKSGDEETDMTQFNARARITGMKYRYSFEYSNTTTESTIVSQGDSHDRKFTVDTWNMIRGFELQNMAEFETLDNISSTRVNSRAMSRFSKGPNTDFFINIGGSYQKTGDYAVYSLNGTGTMQHKINPALLSLTTAGAGLQHVDNPSPLPDPFAPIDPNRNPLLPDEKSTDYNLSLAETLQYSGIRNVILQGGASLGVAAGGVPYSVFGGFTAAPVTWLSLNGNYSYTVTFISGEDTQSSQDMRFGAVAYLMRGLNVELQGDRQTTSVHNDISYDVTYDRLDLRVNWLYGRHSLNANAYVARNETTNPALGSGRSNLWGYGIQYGAALMRNLSLVVRYNYDKDRETDMTRSQLNPRLVWYYGKMIVTAEYREDKNEELGSSRTDRRIYLSLKRFFRKKL